MGVLDVPSALFPKSGTHSLSPWVVRRRSGADSLSSWDRPRRLIFRQKWPSFLKNPPFLTKNARILVSCISFRIVKWLDVQTPLRSPSHSSKWKWRDYFEALHQHFYRAKIIIYLSLLFVVAASVILHEQFPELHPPWQLLRWVVTLVLFGVLFVPPALTVIRGKRK